MREHKEWEAERMAAYAGQVDSLDQSVGRIMDALRRAQADDNTLVIFLSDNGASDQAVGALDKPGQTWRIDGTPTQVGNQPDIPPGGPDTFVTGGPPWANVSNTPFRRHKQSNHEGGIATPLIAWWPGVIKQAGAISHEPAHITDVTATCLDVAGVEYPAQFHGRHVLPLAGRSLLPVFQGGRIAGPRTLCWATSGCRAIRIGAWKLVAAKGGPWELYNLATDRTELNDLAQQQPERVAAMAKAFDQWRRSPPEEPARSARSCAGLPTRTRRRPIRSQDSAETRGRRWPREVREKSPTTGGQMPGFGDAGQLLFVGDALRTDSPAFSVTDWRRSVRHHPLPFVLALLAALGAVGDGRAAAAEPAGEAAIKIVTFDVDATPPVGSAMAYDPVKRLDELTLRCRGIVLLGADKPIVLCAVDWIGIANEGHDAFRDALAEAAGTTRDRVAVHTVHQHDAPGCDFTAERIIRELGVADYGRFEGTFHRQVIQRAADAIRAALPAAQAVTHYGWGVAEVKEVASNRRIMGPDGRVRATRYTTTEDPALRAEPEGVIDPQVSLLSFWNGDRPLAVLSYYACHPQSYYRTGVPSPDFPGIARFIRGQAVPEALHVHFNGAGGNIGAGKYNDGAKENRMRLAHAPGGGNEAGLDHDGKAPADRQRPRLADRARASARRAALERGGTRSGVEDRTRPRLHRQGRSTGVAAALRSRATRSTSPACAWASARVLHLPGELFVEYQLAAKAMRPDLHVAMAAYGDYGPGYIGTTAAYPEGGYETSPGPATWPRKSSKVLTEAMQKLLDVKP